MIVKLQEQLGGNFVLGREGANLRGFLVAAYGLVGGVGILEQVVGIAAGTRRRHTLAVAPKWLTV